MGGKVNLAKDILDRAPIKTGRKFIDLFAGRGALTYRAWAMGLQFSEWVINDKNTVPHWWIPLRKIGDKIKVPARSRQEFERQRALAEKGDLRAKVLAPWLCYAGGYFNKGGSMSAKGNGGRRSPEAEERNVRLQHRLIHEHNPKFSSLDWLDCLRREEPGPMDLIQIDFPYMECETYAYAAWDVLPIEVIDYLLRHPELNWVLCEHLQPMYLEALGQPVFKKKVQLRANVGQALRQETRIECVWTSESVRAHRAKVDPKGACTFSLKYDPAQPVDRKPVDYADLESVKQALKEVLPRIRGARLYMNEKMREQLLPLLVALKKLTFRKKPGYQATLRMLGLNVDTVKSWFYRSFSGDEVIAAIEPPVKKTSKPTSLPWTRDEIESPEQVMSEAGCRLAKAVLENKIVYAKRLAKAYLQIWNENHHPAQINPDRKAA